MSCGGISSALRRLPPSTIAHIQSFVPPSAWLINRNYATSADIPGPSAWQHQEHSQRTGRRPRGQPRPDLINLDTFLGSQGARTVRQPRSSDQLRSIGDALNAGAIDEAIRMGRRRAEALNAIAKQQESSSTARDQREGGQPLPLPPESSAGTRSLATSSIVPEVFILLQSFLEAENHPEAYAEIFQYCQRLGLVRKGQMMADHTLRLARVAVRNPNSAWIENLENFIKLPETMNMPERPLQLPLEPRSRIIFGLMRARKQRISIPGVIQMFMDEVAHGDINAHRPGSLVSWVIIASHQRGIGQTLKFQKQFMDHVERIAERRSNHVWSGDDITAMIKFHEIILSAIVTARAQDAQQSLPPWIVGSRIPSRIADQLLNLIGGADQLTTSFITIWMQAELAAKRYDQAKAVWDIFDLSAQPDELHQSLASSYLDVESFSSRPRPDMKAWSVYFRLRKALPAANETEPSLQVMLRRMYDTVPIANFTTPALNDILALIAHPTQYQGGAVNPNENLPMLLLLLKHYDWDPAGEFGPRPDSRTIRLAVSALVNLWRCFGAYFDPLFGSYAAHLARTSRQIRKTDCLLRAEWRMVEGALRGVLGDAETEYVTSDILERICSSAEMDTLQVSRGGVHVMPDGSTLPDILIRPVSLLVENAINLVLSERCETQLEVETALERLMERTYERIVPQQPIAWHAVEGDRTWHAVRDEPEVKDEVSDRREYLVNRPEEI
ncbi:hypothetical protein BD324DRAFT_624743, partial [Kockovaella imperatae]